MNVRTDRSLLDEVLAQTRVLALALPEAVRFLPDEALEGLETGPANPRLLDVAERMPEMVELAGNETRALVAAIARARHQLHWEQSYSAGDGFSEDYLARYGFFNLVSDKGPFVSRKVRVSFGFWDRGLFYKDHWHEPEELYVVLAGGARFISEGRGDRDCKPADTVYHASNQRHAIDMAAGPLLVMALWKGNNLFAKSSLSQEAAS